MLRDLLQEINAVFSLKHLLQLVGISLFALLLQFLAKRIISSIIRRSIRRSHLRPKREEEQRQQTLIAIFYTTTVIAVWTSAILISLGIYGISVGPLLAGAGVAGVALGFGAQTMVKDFLAGIFIIGENQYRIGDVVAINQTISGTVETLSLRMTSLRDLEGKVHYIPNGSIEVATNMTMEYANVELDISVERDTDIDKAEKIIEKVGFELKNDEKWKEYILEAPYMLRLDSFSDSALVLKVLCKTAPGEQWAIKGQFLRRLKKAFDREGIIIPFPQMVVHKPTAKE